jgi:hypothetical protein
MLELLISPRTMPCGDDETNQQYQIGKNMLE